MYPRIFAALDGSRGARLALDEAISLAALRAVCGQPRAAAPFSLAQ